MEIILRETGGTEWECYLTGDTNFRYQVFPEYKANRLGKPRPVHLEACKRRLVTEWAATYIEGMEADDQLGIRQCVGDTNDSIICSIDKDLLQIPGWHYNFVKHQRTYVTPMEGLRHFYWQLLVGDSSDGIKGAAGIGPVKADKILDGIDDELDMFNACLAHFHTREELIMNAKVLHIWQRQNDWWVPPDERVV